MMVDKNKANSANWNKQLIFNPNMRKWICLFIKFLRLFNWILAQIYNRNQGPTLKTVTGYFFCIKIEEGNVKITHDID